MGVVQLVTVHAVAAGKRVIDVAAMAQLAGQVGMDATQGEISVCIVVEARLRPPARVVAGRAVLAVSALVHIVDPVARNALACKLHFAGGLEMAGRALDTRMSVGQCESGLCFVIESRRLPVVGTVAVLACGTVESMVRVVQTMTAEAIRGGCEKALIRMAGDALPALVSSGQRELGRIVVERCGGPASLGMAVGAGFAEFTGVRIAVTVAIHTAVGRVTVRGFCVVAGAADSDAVYAQ